MNADRHYVLRTLKDRSYEELGEPTTLASGRLSNVYIDVKSTLSIPHALHTISLWCYHSIRTYNPKLSDICGISIGGAWLIGAVLSHSYTNNGPLWGTVVRTEKKNHGSNKRIEGIPPGSGREIAIVEDVVTTGGSVLEVICYLRSLGLIPKLVVSVVDREEGGRKVIEGTGCSYYSYTTLSEIRSM